jgi:hypothetical protein
MRLPQPTNQRKTNTMKYEVHYRPAGDTWSPTNLGIFDTQAEAFEASTHWLTGYARTNPGTGAEDGRKFLDKPTGYASQNGLEVRVMPAGHTGHLAGHAEELLQALKGARRALAKALPHLPPDGLAVYCGEWIGEIDKVIAKATGSEEAP